MKLLNHWKSNKQLRARWSATTMITRSNAYEQAQFKFVAYASDVGLGVNEWPDKLPTDLGNKSAFQFFTTERDPHGELLAVIYKQIAGCIWLHVIND